uniref:PHD-type domain-containing protein n=1 Tax=Panagrolaimus davidi TaxID=227884 RepID=A0A914P0I0_9BILA
MAKQIVKGGGLEPSDRLASAETEEMAKIVQENGSDGLVSAENEEVAQKSKALKSKRRSCRCGKFKRDKLAYCLGPKCPYDWIHFSCAGIKVLPDRFYCCDKCRDEDLAAAKYNEEIEKQEKAALVDFEYCTCKKQLGGDMVGCDRDNCDIGWYHPECVGLTEIPKGKWVCPNCKAKKKKKPIVQSERTRTQSSNTPQGSSTSGLEGTAEATNNEGDTGDDLLLAPYLAQVPKEKRNNLIFPIGLVKVLNDDSDLVNRQLKLPKLPPRYTLDDILTKVS